MLYSFIAMFRRREGERGKVEEVRLDNQDCNTAKYFAKVEEMVRKQ